MLHVTRQEGGSNSKRWRGPVCRMATVTVHGRDAAGVAGTRPQNGHCHGARPGHSWGGGDRSTERPPSPYTAGTQLGQLNHGAFWCFPRY